MKTEDAKGGMFVRTSSGKLYCLHGEKDGSPSFRPIAWDESEMMGPFVMKATDWDRSVVRATQWQINEKHPEGRWYQACRYLKLADLTPVDDPRT